MNLRLLAILPESIGGRLTLSSLISGFNKCNIKLKVLDSLSKNFISDINKVSQNKYDYIFSYDYTGYVIQKDYNLDIPIISYFSDSITTELASNKWETFYPELKNEKNYTFYWDHEHTKALKGEIKNLYYLPHCVDTDVYKNLNLLKVHDIMFAGRLTFPGRIEIITSIFKKFPNIKLALYSHPEHFNIALSLANSKYKHFFEEAYRGFITTEESMSQAINQAKVVINLTSQGLSNLNYRVFQTLACETFLLTDYRKELGCLFDIHEQITYYTNNTEFFENLEDILVNPKNYTYKKLNARKMIESAFDSERAAKYILNTLSF